MSWTAKGPSATAFSTIHVSKMSRLSRHQCMLLVVLLATLGVIASLVSQAHPSSTRIELQHSEESPGEREYGMEHEALASIPIPSPTDGGHRSPAGARPNGSLCVSTDCLPMSNPLFTVNNDEGRTVYSEFATERVVSIRRQESWQNISAAPDGWRPLDLDLSDDLGESVSVILEAPRKVIGSVVSAEDGEPLGEYRVVVTQGKFAEKSVEGNRAFSREFEIKTGPDFSIGGFHQVEGLIDSFSFTVRAEGFVDYRSTEYAIGTEPLSTSVNIALVKGEPKVIVVEGVVLTHDGVAVEDAQCHLIREDELSRAQLQHENGPLDPAKLYNYRPGFTRNCKSVETGAFRLEASVPSEYYLAVISEQAPLFLKSVGFLDLQVAPYLEEARLSAFGTVNVRVVGSTSASETGRYRVDVKSSSRDVFSGETVIADGGMTASTVFNSIPAGTVRVNLYARLTPGSPFGELLVDTREVNVGAGLLHELDFRVSGSPGDASRFYSVPVSEDFPESSWLAVAFSNTSGKAVARSIVLDGGLTRLSFDDAKGALAMGIAYSSSELSRVALALPSLDDESETSKGDLRIRDTRLQIQTSPESGIPAYEAVKFQLDDDASAWAPLFNALRQSGLPSTESLDIIGLPDGVTFKVIRGPSISRQLRLKPGETLRITL